MDIMCAAKLLFFQLQFSLLPTVYEGATSSFLSSALIFTTVIGKNIFISGLH